MNISRNFLIFLFVLIGLGTGFSAFAASGSCPTDNGAGVVCSGGTPYFCSALSGCSAPSQCANWSGSVCSSVVESAGYCPVNCNGADSCGFCNSCTTGNTLCGAYPAQTCKANVVVPTGCSSYSQCTNICSACSAGYELVTGTCVGATLKLGIDSVTGTFLKNSTNPLMSILFSGYVGIGTTDPHDTLSIGNSGSAPLGSLGTGHNYTSTYLSADDYALTNYGLVKTLIASATSSSALFGGTTTGNIWNLNSGNVGIGITNPGYKLDVNGTMHVTAGTLYGLVLGDPSVASSRPRILQNSPAGIASFNTFQDNSVSKFSWGYGGAGTSPVNSFFISRTSDFTSPDFLLTPTGAFGIGLNGSVGIGTTAPGAKLNVYGAAGDTRIRVTETAATGYGVFEFYNNSGLSGAFFQLGSTATGYGGANSFNMYSILYAPLVFGTNNAERIRILAGGNVGIGTSVPNDTFSIGNSGSAPVGSLATGHNYTMTYLSSDPYALTNYGTVMTLLNAATSSSALFGGTISGNIWSLNSGNVGIGITNPTSKLHVVNTNDSVPTNRTTITTGLSGYASPTNINTQSNGDKFVFWNSSVYKGAWGMADNGLQWFQSTAGGGVVGDFAFFGGTAGVPSEVFRIKSSGNVGIGTTIPGVKLTIADTNKVTDSNGNLFIYTTDTATQNYGGQISLGGSWNGINETKFGTISGRKETAVSGSAAGYLSFGTASSVGGTVNENMRITSNGSVGIGTTTPSGKVHIMKDSVESNEGSGGLVITANATNSSSKLIFGTRANSYSYIQSMQQGTNWLSRPLILQAVGGSVGINTVSPLDTFSIGTPGGIAAPAGSAGTGHNYTSSYIDSDDYALTNYGIVKTLINNAASSIPILWGGAVGSKIWNLNSGSVGIGTSNPNGIFEVALNSGAGEKPLQGFLAGTPPALGGYYGDYNMGYKFTVNADGNISALWAHVPDSSSNTVRLYDALTGEVLASTVVNCVTDTWTSGSITPVTVYAGRQYIVAVRIFNTGFNYGSIGVPASGPGNIIINESMFDSSTDSMPMTPMAGDMYGSTDITFNLAGSETGLSGSALMVDNVGNVGIGTTNPLVKLDVAGVGSTLAITNTDVLGIDKGGNLQFKGNWATGNPAVVFASILGAKATEDDGAAYGYLSFSTFGSTPTNGINERMRIDTNGNVGIGTTNPNAKLYVTGGGVTDSIGTGATINANGLFMDNDELSTTAGTLYIGNSASSYKNVSIGLNFNIKSDGNVGIGTSIPNDKLSIGNSGVAPIGSLGTGHNYTMTYLSSDPYALTNYGTVMTLLNAATSSSALWNGTKNGNIYNGDAGAGNVGIGTTNPATTLQVDADYKRQGAAIIRSGEGGIPAFNFTTTGVSYPRSLGVGIMSGTGYTADIPTKQTDWSGGYGGYVGIWSDVNSGNEVGSNAVGVTSVVRGTGDSMGIGYYANLANFTGTTNKYGVYISGETKNYFSGNVGVGTTNPSSKLEISGDIKSSVTGAVALFTAYNPGTNYPRALFKVGNSSSDVNTGLMFAPEYTAAATTKPFSIEVYNNKLNADSSARMIGLGVFSTYSSIHSLGPNGNSAGLPLIFSTQTYLGNNPAIYISNAAAQNVGIGTNIPNDKLSIGNSGVAPVGSLATGHNYTMTYLSSDPYALMNYGATMSLINAATSSLTTYTQPRFATSTVATYNGSQGATYSGANALCAAASAGSHVCTTGEIFNTINSGHTADIPLSTLWINNGPPGYTANANDCMGWSNAAGTNYGTVWIKTAGNDGFGSLQACNNARKYACCK